MHIDDFGRAALVLGYLATLGQASLLSQANSQPARPRQGLEQKVALQKPPRSNFDYSVIYDRLMRTIPAIEEEMRPSAKPVNHNIDKSIGEIIGYDPRILDDLSKLASFFNRDINLTNLCVYLIDDGIVMENLDSWSLWANRLIFYQRTNALELEYNYPNFTGRKLRISQRNGQRTVEKEELKPGDPFAYVAEAGGYEFSKVHAWAWKLTKEFRRLRKSVPPVESWKEDDDNWYYSHPVDRNKYIFIKGQFRLLAKGIYAAFGEPMDSWDFTGTGKAGQYSIVDATPDLLRVYSYNEATNTSTVLVVRNSPIAEKTTIAKRKGQPDEVSYAPLYLVGKR